MKKTIVFITLLLALLFFVPASYAQTYYISPVGNDSNSGSELNPWATFKYAFSRMSGGDTLIVEDGVYMGRDKMIGYFNDSEKWNAWGPPAGSPGAYTTIRAKNPHKVTLDGEGVNRTIILKTYNNIKREYIKIEGIRAINSFSNVISMESSNNIVLKSMAAYNTTPGRYNYVILVSGHDGESYNILLEDVWTWGHGRYGINIVKSHDVTVRRGVMRYDAGDYLGQPVSGVVAYYSRNVTIENSISFDQAVSQQQQSGFYSTGHFDTNYPNNNNKWLGTISLNTPSSGYNSDSDSGTDNNVYRNCVAWDNGLGLAVIRNTTKNTTIENCLFGNNQERGFSNGGGVTGTILKHNLIINNSGRGIIDSGSYAEKNYNNSWNNAGGNGDPGPDGISQDPGIKYIVRVEPDSPRATDGKDIGANILYRYQDGVFTNQPLWPWPNEDWIKEDMCDPSFLSQVGRTGANTPKWCTTNKTLTEYIWEYLGNPCPAEICGTTAPPKGDINSDNSVDVLDIQALVNHILGIQDYGMSADINQDGSVDVLDVQEVVNIILVP